MKNLMIISMIALAFITTSCKDDEPQKPANTKTYNLEVRDYLGVKGTVTFTETSSTTLTVDIDVKGGPDGTYMAEIRSNSAIEGGNTVVMLNEVSQSGKSSTVTSAMTFEQLKNYNGHVEIFTSTILSRKTIAIADIGGNEMTEMSKTYTLSKYGDYNISGDAKFQKRVDGSTLVTLTMNGLLANTNYPASINVGSTTTVGGGSVTKTLQNVNGNTGKSYTNIRMLNNNVKINYDDWMKYDGYINVYRETASIDNIISQGNIGSK